MKKIKILIFILIAFFITDLNILLTNDVVEEVEKIMQSNLPIKANNIAFKNKKFTINSQKDLWEIFFQDTKGKEKKGYIKSIGDYLDLRVAYLDSNAKTNKDFWQTLILDKIFSGILDGNKNVIGVLCLNLINQVVEKNETKLKKQLKTYIKNWTGIEDDTKAG
ncbi:hypothetical protein GF385_02570, partial [Candidatus Dependentiae bacterium]|nr:hypothetical protein [Candidatus Dependentiae bacterium]